MSETLITWPDVCVFCGDSNGKVGRTANEHWKQFNCGTEYEVIEEKTAWIQDDECKIAALTAALAAATKRAEEAEDDLHKAIIEWAAKLDESEDRWAAAEQARDEYNDMRVSALEEVAGCRERIKEYREKVEQLETDKAFYHDKWLNALEQLKAAEQENARLREGIETTINYVRTGVHCRMIDHKMDSCDCEKISDEFAALLAKPEEKQ